jgi:hypothetical protein
MIKLSLVLAFLLTILTGCQSNLVVSNCRSVQVQGDSKARWLCDKGWSDYWR